MVSLGNWTGKQTCRLLKLVSLLFFPLLSGLLRYIYTIQWYWSIQDVTEQAGNPAWSCAVQGSQYDIAPEHFIVAFSPEWLLLMLPCSFWSRWVTCGTSLALCFGSFCSAPPVVELYVQTVLLPYRFSHYYTLLVTIKDLQKLAQVDAQVDSPHVPHIPVMITGSLTTKVTRYLHSQFSREWL